MAIITETALIDHVDFSGEFLFSKSSTEGAARDLGLSDYPLIALVYFLTTPDAEFDLPQDAPRDGLRPSPSIDQMTDGRYIHDRWVPLMGPNSLPENY